MVLQKPLGIFALLDEESRFPTATAQSLVDKIDAAAKQCKWEHFRKCDAQRGPSSAPSVRRNDGELFKVTSQRGGRAAGSGIRSETVWARPGGATEGTSALRRLKSGEKPAAGVTGPYFEIDHFAGTVSVWHVHVALCVKWCRCVCVVAYRSCSRCMF